MSPPSPCSVAGDAYLVDPLGLNINFLVAVPRGSGTNVVQKTQDYTTWTAQTVAGMTSIWGGCHSRPLRRFFVCGGNQVAASPDTEVWTVSTLPVTFSQPLMFADFVQNAVFIIEQDQNTVGPVNFACTSDGLTWVTGNYPCTTSPRGFGVIGGVARILTNGIPSTSFGSWPVTIDAAGNVNSATGYIITQTAANIRVCWAILGNPALLYGMFRPSSTWQAMSMNFQDTGTSTFANVNTRLSGVSAWHPRAFYLGNTAAMLFPSTGTTAFIVNGSGIVATNYSAITMPFGSTFAWANVAQNRWVLTSRDGVFSTTNFTAYTNVLPGDYDAVFGNL